MDNLNSSKISVILNKKSHRMSVTLQLGRGVNRVLAVYTINLKGAGSSKQINANLPRNLFYLRFLVLAQLIERMLKNGLIS